MKGREKSGESRNSAGACALIVLAVFGIFQPQGTFFDLPEDGQAKAERHQNHLLHVLAAAWMLNRVLVFWQLAAIVFLSLRPSVVIGAIMRQHTADLAIKSINNGEDFYAQKTCDIAVTTLLRI